CIDYGIFICFFFQAEDGIRDRNVTGVQTCALPISGRGALTMGRFFDPAGGGLRVELRSEDGTFFALLRPIAYAADGYAEPFVVPAHLRTFRTDFATVPWVFAWLVPRSGRFLPAAILHDALVPPGDYEGPDVTRAQADHIFREAMLTLRSEEHTSELQSRFDLVCRL